MNATDIITNVWDSINLLYNWTERNSFIIGYSMVLVVVWYNNWILANFKLIIFLEGANIMARERFSQS